MFQYLIAEFKPVEFIDVFEIVDVELHDKKVRFIRGLHLGNGIHDKFVDGIATGDRIDERDPFQIGALPVLVPQEIRDTRRENQNDNQKDEIEKLDNRIAIRRHCQIWHRRDQEPVMSLVAVSYTHLDVYKRQTPSNVAT